MEQGEVWWADLEEPTGSEPGYRKPVVIVQGIAFNRSRIGTVVCVPLTSSLKLADAPGNMLLASRESGLPKDSPRSSCWWVRHRMNRRTARARLA